MAILDKVEKVCNKIPQPIVFFLWMILISSLFSIILSIANSSFIVDTVQNGERIGKIYFVRNIFSADGVRFMLQNSIVTISRTHVMPILVLSIIGLGIAEGSGYLKTLFINTLGGFKSSKKLATLMLLLFGVLSNVATDAGYLVLIPLGAIIFASLKRSPILGGAVAFAGVSGGFTANFFLSGVDAILAGISSTVSESVIPGHQVSIESNYYFAIASTFAIVAVGYFVTEYIMIPKYPFDPVMLKNNPVEMEKITPLQKKALRKANLSFLACIIIVALGIIPENGILRNPETGSIWTDSAFSAGIIMIFALFFGISGLVYGFVSKTISKSEDIINAFVNYIAISSSALAVIIFSFQFLNILEFTNLGMYISSVIIYGIKAFNFTGYPFIIMMIVTIAVINIFIPGMTSKWVAISYVVIPAFVSMGYTPELAQAVYRVGDSTTNVISPAMTYMAIVLSVFNKYSKSANIGSIIAIMIPYSLSFLVTWSGLLILFVKFNLPIGPSTLYLL